MFSLTEDKSKIHMVLAHERFGSHSLHIKFLLLGAHMHIHAEFPQDNSVNGKIIHLSFHILFLLLKTTYSGLKANML